MQSDDVFLTNFRATVSGLEAWAAGLAAVAAIETESDESCWRVACVPHAAQACPFELMLRRDQRFDLTVGPETYEDQPIASLDMFQPLLAAIVAGRVVTSVWSTAGTGLRTGLETRIMPLAGAPWSASHALNARPQIAGEIQRRDHHYVPYARGA
jgi:hypothetical protein